MDNEEVMDLDRPKCEEHYYEERYYMDFIREKVRGNVYFHYMTDEERL